MCGRRRAESIDLIMSETIPFFSQNDGRNGWTRERGQQVEIIYFDWNIK